jgi:hypothetical protein
LEWGAYKEAVDQINGDLSKELDRAGFFVSATLRRRSLFRFYGRVIYATGLERCCVEWPQLCGPPLQSLSAVLA